MCWHLVSSRPYSGKGPTADRGLSPFNPPHPPSTYTVRLLSSFFSAELILHISSSEVFHSSGFLLAATLNTTGLLFLQLQMHSLSSTQTLGLISPEQHTSQKSVLLFLSAYAQNPSSAPHRKSSRATEPLNLGALPISASRSRSCLRAFTPTSCHCRTVCPQTWCMVSLSFEGIARPRGYASRPPPVTLVVGPADALLFAALEFIRAWKSSTLRQPMVAAGRRQKKNVPLFCLCVSKEATLTFCLQSKYPLQPPRQWPRARKSAWGLFERAAGVCLLLEVGYHGRLYSSWE